MKNGQPNKRHGYWTGFILFTVVIEVVAAVVTCEAAGTGALAITARHAPKLLNTIKKIVSAMRKVDRFASEALGAIIGKFDELIGGLTSLRTAANAWCFVAGTLIATAHGMVPIEQIQEGDLVFSADEHTEQVTLQPVIQLYRHQHDSADLWEIAYDHDSDPATPAAEITCTSEHPFWSETRSEFIPAAELQPGEDLRSVLGEAMRVVSVTPLRGPPNDEPRTGTTTIYNFAVANNHSYFAGDGGVWVHKVCRDALDHYKLDFDSIFSVRGGTTIEFDATLEEVLFRARTYDALNDGQLREVGMYLHLRTQVTANPVSEIQLFCARSGMKQLSETGSGTVARTIVDGREDVFFGVSSPHALSLRVDRSDFWERMQQRFSDLNGIPWSSSDNRSEWMKHAEVMTLIRAEQEYGSLQGAVVRIVSDRTICTSCYTPTGISGLQRAAELLGVDSIILESPNGFRSTQVPGNTVTITP